MSDAADRIFAAFRGLPEWLRAGIADLVETVAAAPDVEEAIARAKQNALADAQDAGAEATADNLLVAARKVGL